MPGVWTARGGEDVGEVDAALTCDGGVLGGVSDSAGGSAGSSTLSSGWLTSTSGDQRIPGELRNTRGVLLTFFSALRNGVCSTVRCVRRTDRLKAGVDGTAA